MSEALLRQMLEALEAAWLHLGHEANDRSAKVDQKIMRAIDAGRDALRAGAERRER